MASDRVDRLLAALQHALDDRQSPAALRQIDLCITVCQQHIDDARTAAVHHASAAAVHAASNNQFSEAVRCYSRALSQLCDPPAELAPLSNFGLMLADVRSLSLPADQSASAAALLLGRSAAALSAGRRCRALADAYTALRLNPSVDSSVQCAQACLSLGACNAALAVLMSQGGTGERQRQLSAIARRDGMAARIEAIMADPEAVGPVPEDLAFIGPMELKQLGGGKGRGWVAAEDITRGQLLLVEPAVFPLAPPETDAEPLPLFAATASVLARGDAAADALRDLLGCMHPLAAISQATSGSGAQGGEVCPSASGEALPMERDAAVAPHVAAIAATTGLAREEAILIEQKLQRNQMSLTTR